MSISDLVTRGCLLIQARRDERRRYVQLYSSKLRAHRKAQRPTDTDRAAILDLER